MARFVSSFGRIACKMQSVTVRVPASTSNLGPGFDCLGVALRIYNYVIVSRNKAVGRDSMAAEAARFFFETAKLEPFAWSCSIAGDVPPCRGLGSSVTVRLGVLHGLNALAGRPLDRNQIFEMCAEMEGHPDNAAPAEFGGFNVVRGTEHQKFGVATRLRFVLLIPAFGIATNQARKILPPRINRAGAVESCGNACAITAAFAARNYEKLRGAFGDHFHQPFREKLIPFFYSVVEAGEGAGALGGFLSGSGSTIACLALRSPEKVATAMLKAAGLNARSLITTADNGGTRLLPFRNPKSEIRNHHASLA
jgi:homoserine kinase